MKPLFFSALCALAPLFLLAQNDDPVYTEPFSFWWQGKAGSAVFEIQVDLDFARQSGGCIPVSGIYFYRSEVIPLPIEGSYCPTFKTLFLESKTSKETFRFSEFDALKPSKGLKEKNGQKQEVEMEALMAKDRIVFLKKIAEESKREALQVLWQEGTGRLAATVDSKSDLYGQTPCTISSYSRGGRLVLDTDGSWNEQSLHYQMLPSADGSLVVAQLKLTKDFDAPNMHWKVTLGAKAWIYRSGAWSVLQKSTILYQNIVNQDEGVICQISLWGISALVFNYPNPDDYEHPLRLIWDWDGKSFVKRK